LELPDLFFKGTRVSRLSDVFKDDLADKASAQGMTTARVAAPA